MYRAKRWKMEEACEAAAELAARLGTSRVVGQILINRGICDVERAREFLEPNLRNLARPELLPGLPAAAERIARAIRDREKIVIYGDYDVDGITATSILWHAITLLGGVVESYIPHRIEEGYGLNCEAIGQLAEVGAKLIVTVDCGITALEPAAVARQRGVELIVTDHHHWHGDPPSLPDCCGIVHPRLPGEQVYPNPHLCGAGVAFKLAWAIGQAISGAVRVSESFREFLLEATALAALGTIADVVPLVGENRVLAHFGLSGLRHSKLVGIKALIESASLTGKALDTYDVGFLLAPRLNACGRLGHAALAVEMLTVAGEERAREIATYLESQNRARQTVEKGILEQAIAQVEQNNWATPEHRALVLAAEGWHAGVIGIVASRIVERYCRPTVMIALNGETGQGSARSIAGFHLAEALDACDGCLLGHGGHEMAAGLKIRSERLGEFREVFGEVARGKVTEEMLMPQIRVECSADLPQITEALVKDLCRLGPFGHGNRRPTLCIEDAVVMGSPRRVGKTGDHLQLSVRQKQQVMRCIAFGAGEMSEKLPAGVAVRLAVEPGINEFNGRRSVELEIRDFQVMADEAAAIK